MTASPKPPQELKAEGLPASIAARVGPGCAGGSHQEVLVPPQALCPSWRLLGTRSPPHSSTGRGKTHGPSLACHTGSQGTSSRTLVPGHVAWSELLGTGAPQRVVQEAFSCGPVSVLARGLLMQHEE